SGNIRPSVRTKKYESGAVANGSGTPGTFKAYRTRSLPFSLRICRSDCYELPETILFHDLQLRIQDLRFTFYYSRSMGRKKNGTTVFESGKPNNRAVAIHDCLCTSFEWSGSPDDSACASSAKRF